MERTRHFINVFCQVSTRISLYISNALSSPEIWDWTINENPLTVTTKVALARIHSNALSLITPGLDL